MDVKIKLTFYCRFFFVSSKQNCSKYNTTARCFLQSDETTDGGFTDYCNYCQNSLSDSGSKFYLPESETA